MGLSHTQHWLVAVRQHHGGGSQASVPGEELVLHSGTGKCKRGICDHGTALEGWGRKDTALSSLSELRLLD